MSKTVQDLFRSERTEWIQSARMIARKLLTQRQQITIVDVLNELPRPQYVHPNTTGHIFRDKDFKLVGFRKSTSKFARGRFVGVWELNEEAMPHVSKVLSR